MGKTPDEIFGERQKRVQDAIALREPDRVPFLPCNQRAALCNLPARINFSATCRTLVVVV